MIKENVAPKVKELFNHLESLKFAFRDLNDVDKQANKKKFKQYKDNYVTVLNRVKDASNRAQRNELLGSGNGEGVDDEDSTEDRYIAEGEMIMDKNQEILQQTLMRVHDARQLGQGGVDMLRKQNEQLVKVSEDLDQMETSLDVSKKVLRQMGLKLATDKYIWILLLLVCAAIVAVCMFFCFVFYHFLIICTT